MQTTVSDALLTLLRKYGIRHIAGLPAAQIAGIMDGASRGNYFSYVTTRHEEAAAHMAHAISRVTGTMGVCFGTVGPGATNLVPGVAAAWGDNIPMLVITANNQRKSISPGKDLLQNADQIELYRPITKWNAQIRDPERAPELIEQAIRIATSGRPGPVHLDIPCDVGLRRIEFDADQSFDSAYPPCAHPGAIAEAAELLRNAKRPLLLAGGGVARAGGTEAFRALMARTGFPATTSPMGKGVVPPDSPANIGCGGFLGGEAHVQALQEADVILAVGCKFSTWILVDKPPAHFRPKGQKLIHIDIDAASLGKNTRADLGIVSDARLALEQLDAALAGSRFAMDVQWPGKLQERHRAYRAKVDAIADQTRAPSGRINEAAAIRMLSGLADPDAIFCFDGGQTMEWSHTFIHPSHPDNSLFNPGMGHLGAGLPFANAAKLAHPGRQVVLVTGDGALGCTVQELETAARYGLKVMVVVMNDSCWGMYRPFGDYVFDNPNFGIRLTDVDFAAVAKGFGCVGETVTRLDQLPAAFQRAAAAERPAVIDVVCEFAQHPMDFVWPTVVLHDMELPVRG